MRIVAFAFLCAVTLGSRMFAAAPAPEPVSIHRQAEAGVPLRVYLTKRLPKRLDEPVHAKLLEPIFSFDHEIIPAGSEVTGRVSKLIPVSRFQRFSALLGGDFTPLHQAEVEFTAVTLSDGRQIPVQTIANTGLYSIYDPAKAKRAAAAAQKRGAVQQAKDQIVNRATARAESVVGMVRGPDKMEKFGDFFLMKLPYHPQWVRKGTRFDAPLSAPVDFGAGTIDRADLAQLGGQPPNDSVVHTRFITTATSKSARLGDKVSAVISQPLFSGDNKLVLPEGTRLTGTVTQARPARWFHRGGQLRFAFDHVDLPEGSPRPSVAIQQPATKVQAVVDSAESGGAGQVEVDAEGNVKAVESKTRFILPVISVLIATRGMDHDGDRQEVNGANSNNSGRHVLGGGLGFGLLGMVAARSSKLTGTALGYYGLAWSVFRNIVARGAEVEFEKDAAMDIRFGTRVSPTQAQ